MMNLTSKKSKSLLLFKRAWVLLCFLLCSLIANAGGSSFTYSYNVKVNQGAAPVGSGTVYLSATATVYDSNKNQWGSTQSPSKSVELNGLKDLSISCEQEREDNDPKKNPFIQFTNVTLKAVPMAGSKFTGWTWSGGSSSAASITIANSELEQCPNNRGDQSATYTNSTAYTAQFIPRTYFYKTAGATVTAGGRVCMTVDGVRPDDASASWLESVPVGTTTESQNADENGKYARATIVRYYHALSPGDEYEFVGWYDSKGSELSKSIDFAYNLVATSENNNSPTTTSIQAVFVLKNSVTMITSDNAANTGLFTGTNIFKEGDATYGKYPYCKKRPIDVSAAFDESGNPLFNQLFVFGLTTNGNNLQVTVDGLTSHKITIPDASNSSNAVTPCYIYTKSGNGYSLSKTILNVNVATKPIDFNIVASGQKIYFTGYAPSISCGSTWEENGVFFISGQNNIDLYFDNLQLFARPKSQNGTTTVSQQKFSITGLGDASILYRDDVDGNIGLSGIDVKFYTQGTGSVFCFQPIKNGSTFTPKIHLLNDNLLESTQGVHLYVYVNFILTLDRNASQHSAPIQVIHNKNTIGTATELTIDDVWNSQHTNGVLNLARLDSRPAPTIDLGYENTTLNINGGQLFLSNSFNNSDSYDVSYAISYRQKSMMDGNATIFGLGDDQPGGTVLFNDGTINCKPLRDQDFNSTQGQKLFHNAESMKCPENTYIRGGSFNCNVLACSSTTSKGASPKNDKNGDALCVVSVPVKSINPNNTAVLPENWVDIAVEKGAKRASEVLYGGSYNYYKTESMTPETVIVGDEQVAVVNLMLPSYNICFKEVLTTPWVACFPQMTVSALTQSQDLGGDVEVPFALSADDGLTKVVRTSKLLYGEIDHYLVNLIEGVEIVDGYNLKYEIPSDGETKPSITLDDEAPGASCGVTNEAQYAIYDKVYMVIPLVANQWKMFVPPFDVANVYVIEPYAEADLLNQYDDNRDGKLTNESGVNEVTRARYAQAYRNMDFLYQWVYSIVALGSNSDIWSNASQAPAMGNIYSYGTFMQTWLEMYEGMADKPTVKNCIQQLYHYKSNNEGYPAGMTRWDANFYLYEADATEWTIGANSLNTGWKEVPTISMKRKINEDHNVIMKKGGVYVMNFPSTIKNNEIYDYINTWDYWTGKYIILEGYPEEDIDTDGNEIPDDKAQILSGSQYDWNGTALTETVLAPYETDNIAALRGNFTFSKLNISEHDNAYVLNNYFRGKDVNYDMESDDSQTMLDPTLPHNVYVNTNNENFSVEELSPGEGFVLANIPARAGMKPRAINIKTGEITYRDETTTSLPTISGNNQMMVYNIEGGLGIVPVVAQQVSIYNAAGQLVTSQYLTDEVHISLPTGIYLIAGAKDQFKAVVK